MSLTSFLEQRDVRERFNAAFSRPRMVLRGEIRARPTNPRHAGLIGTAFDYLLRVYISNINGTVWDRPWIAESAVNRLECALAAGRPVFPPGVTRTRRGLLTTAQRITREARIEHEKCLATERVSTTLIRSTLLLAQLDTFFRCGLLSESFGTTDDADVEDLRRMLGLARRLPSSPFVSSRVCVLDPSFDKASRLVGGADADVLIDDTLIDVKTTKRLKFTAEMFRQLVGYYVLSKIGGIAHGVRPKPQIRHLAVYFARFGVFASLPVEPVVTASNFPAFLRWFKRRATSGPLGPRTTLRLGADMTVTF